MANKPIDIELYDQVKQMANEIFKSNRGIYRSMWISKKYIELGGRYSSNKKKSNVDRWLKEQWVDLNQPIKKNNEIIGYERCGNKNIQNDLYPLCRPSRRINKDTPIIYQDIDKRTIKKVNREKQIKKNKGNIKFI